MAFSTPRLARVSLTARKIRPLRLRQVEAAFDTFQALVEPVHATVNAGKALFDRRYPDLEVVHIVKQPVGLFVQPTQELEGQIVWFLGHG